MDRWESLNTINDIIKFCDDNPEYKKFLDKPITFHVDEEFLKNRHNWNNNPQVRFSEDHDELVFE